MVLVHGGNLKVGKPRLCCYGLFLQNSTQIPS